MYSGMSTGDWWEKLLVPVHVHENPTFTSSGQRSYESDLKTVRLSVCRYCGGVDPQILLHCWSEPADLFLVEGKQSLSLTPNNCSPKMTFYNAPGMTSRFFLVLAFLRLIAWLTRLLLTSEMTITKVQATKRTSFQKKVTGSLFLRTVPLKHSGTLCLHINSFQLVLSTMFVLSSVPLPWCLYQECLSSAWFLHCCVTLLPRLLKHGSGFMLDMCKSFLFFSPAPEATWSG